MNHLSLKVVLFCTLSLVTNLVMATGMSVRSQGSANYTSSSGKSNSLSFTGSFSFPSWVSGSTVTTTITPSGGSGTYTYSLDSGSTGCTVNTNSGVVTATSSGFCRIVVSDGLGQIKLGPAAVTASNLPPPTCYVVPASSASCGVSPSGVTGVLASDAIMKSNLCQATNFTHSNQTVGQIIINGSDYTYWKSNETVANGATVSLSNIIQI
jgi:hypothetical protein